MKKTFLTIASILLLIQGVFSQNKSDREQIAAIDKMMQEIKANLKSYVKTEKVGDNSGYRYTYTKDNELKQITVYYKDDNVDKYVVWYFDNGQLIYSEQVWTNRTTKNTIDNEKFYLSNNHLVAWFKADKQVDVTSQEFKKTGDELTAYAAKLKTDNMK